VNPETQLTSIDFVIVVIALVLWIGFLPVWLRREEWGKDNKSSLKKWIIVFLLATTMAMLLMTKTFFEL
jgi:hypothetical protein